LVVLRFLDPFQREALHGLFFVNIDVFRRLAASVRGGVAWVTRERLHASSVFGNRWEQIARRQFGACLIAIVWRRLRAASDQRDFSGAFFQILLRTYTQGFAMGFHFSAIQL
jgi:hypothetical protein